MFTSFDVIRNFGIVGGLILIVVMGLVYGIIIFFIEGGIDQRWESSTKNWILIGLAAVVLLPFPFIFWGITTKNVVRFLGIGIINFFVQFVFVGFCLSDEFPFYIKEKDFFSKVVLVLTASIIWMFAFEGLYNYKEKMQLLKPQQRINFSKEEIRQGTGGEYAIKALNNDPDRKYFIALDHINQGKNHAAGESLREYVLNKFTGIEKEKELFFWLGIVDCLQGKYKSAVEKFRKAKESHLVLASLFADGNNFNEQTFLDLAKGLHSRASFSEGFLGEIRSLCEDRWKREAEVKSTSDLALIMVRLDELEKKINIGSDSASKKKEKRADIQNKILGFVKEVIYKNVPEFPETNYGPLLRNAGILLYMAGFIFLLSMFMAIAILQKRVDSIAIWYPIRKVFGKLSWHSSKAREISVRIALLEKEKGVFSREIRKVQQTSFPFDLILAVWYLKRAEKTAKIWDISSQEKEDIEFIAKEVRMLVGKLIPQGNEETLAVIQGLRNKAVEIFDSYRKTRQGYARARESLLGVLSELAIVGDILEVRKGSEQITGYQMLGVSDDSSSAEIKKAWREIMLVIHPDCNSGKEHLAALASSVNGFYEILSNPTRREAYDTQMNF